MVSRWPVVLCGLACAVGCAAEQVDDPSNSGSGAAPSAGTDAGGGATAGSGSVAGSSSPALGGSTSTQGGSGTAGSTASSAGTSSAGTTSGQAGSVATGGAASGGSGGTATAAGTSGSGGNKPASTSLPFSEDFEDGQANGFIAWNDKGTAGEWVVVADGATKVYAPKAAVSELEFGVGGSTTWTDVAVSVKVKLADENSAAQVALRFKDAKTYLVVEVAEGKYKLRGRADGSTTDLIAPSPKPVITAGTWYTVGVTVKGTTVNLTLDGKPIGTPATCNALISNGGIAFGVDEGSASFDDVSVTVAP